MLPALLSVTALAFAPYPSSTRPIGTLPLFVITVDHMNSADKSTLQTLSGLLARDSPRIYTLENTDGPLTSAYALWLEQLTDVYGVATNMTYNRNFPGLLALFTNGNGQSGAVRVRAVGAGVSSGEPAGAVVWWSQGLAEVRSRSSGGVRGWVMRRTCGAPERGVPERGAPEQHAVAPRALECAHR
jgi:hypothetical protein